jgi:hypothetical protein
MPIIIYLLINVSQGVDVALVTVVFAVAKMGVQDVATAPSAHHVNASGMM